MTADAPRALVTGGSRGIGAAIVCGLLDAGQQVVSLDLLPPTGERAGLRTLTADLMDEAATAAAARAALADGPVLTLIHNAGAIRPALLADVRTEDLAALARLHLAAAVLLAQAVLPGMRAAGFGRIVLIASRAALGLATRTSYAATKAGLIALARTWALELGPAGITVNAIAPGPIETGMFHDILPQGDARLAALVQSVPVRRLGRPEDVAHAALFLADPASGFITGQTLFVCGGSSIGTAGL